MGTYKFILHYPHRIVQPVLYIYGILAENMNGEGEWLRAGVRAVLPTSLDKSACKEMLAMLEKIRIYEIQQVLQTRSPKYSIKTSPLFDRSLKEKARLHPIVIQALFRSIDQSDQPEFRMYGVKQYRSEYIPPYANAYLNMLPNLGRQLTDSSLRKGEMSGMSRLSAPYGSDLISVLNSVQPHIPVVGTVHFQTSYFSGIQEKDLWYFFALRTNSMSSYEEIMDLMVTRGTLLLTQEMQSGQQTTLPWDES